MLPPSSSSSASTSTPSVSNKSCFNSDCAESKPPPYKKAWRLRSGDFAELCDRCSLVYEQGRFCETFHEKASGWRTCESCGKRIHCGCIVSAQAFMLLDPGGIECVTCASKHTVVTSNPAWVPALSFRSPFSDRPKNLSGGNWTQLAGTGPVPWRQAPGIFNSSVPSPDLPRRAPYDIDGSMGISKVNVGERIFIYPMEKKKAEDFSERLMRVNLAIGTPVTFENGNSGNKYMEQGRSCLDVPQQPGSVKELSTPQPSSVKKELSTPQPSSVKKELYTPHFAMPVPCVSASDMNGQANGHVVVSGTNLQPAHHMVQQFQGNRGTLNHEFELSGDSQIRHAKPGLDARGRLLRYWPRFTDQELQQISKNANYVITPLFEKMLSVSDAGKIGRLVLPKKCAEAYFPPISHPEGLPLVVQDLLGKEWVFQFRFWPNNTSRMYVLEGVTPCIQSLQLQAGDIVTFSRLEPGGKLVMGYRKAFTAPSHQAELAVRGMVAKGDKSGYVSKDVEGPKPVISRKRKNSILGSKSKHMKIEKDDLIELKITREEAQGLLRPPPQHVPSVVMIEGFEFEEFEDGPILGKPTHFTTGSKGEKIQLAQCEVCFKWRKLPVNALITSKWTCLDNLWDPDRSLCSAAQELTTEQLEDLLTLNSVDPKHARVAKHNPDNGEALDRLDTLADLAILGEGDSLPTSAQVTTKHPRHKPGCSCIVCIQPPSGKGPKHKHTCICSVCSTVKRRFRTLMKRREKNKSDKEAETTRKSQQRQRFDHDDTRLTGNTESSSPKNRVEVLDLSDDDFNRTESPTTPTYKGQIDLNIQPDREEDLSPGSDSGCMIKFLQDATEKYLRHHGETSSISMGGETSIGGKLQRVGIEAQVEPLGNITILGNNNHDVGNDHPANLSLNASASMTAT